MGSNISKRFLVVVLCVYLIFCTISCSDEATIQNKLYDYLFGKLTKAADIYKAELPRYQLEATKISNYENEQKTSMKSNYAGYSDIIKEMESLIGYWISDGITMKNICYYTVIRTTGGDTIGKFTTHPTEARILDIDQKISKIKEVQVKLAWAKTCNNIAQQTSVNIENLDTVLAKLKFSSGKWIIKHIGENLYSIDGDLLGIYMNKNSSGQWNYYLNNNDFQPRTDEAKALLSIINQVDTYETTFSKSNVKPDPITLPQNMICSPYLINDYYLNELGMTNRPAASSGGNSWGGGGGNYFYNDVYGKSIFQYTKESSTIQELFVKFPSVKKYWDILDNLGFKVTCGIIDKTSWLQQKGIYFETNQIIILRVSSN